MENPLATDQSFGQDWQILNSLLEQGDLFARAGRLDQSFKAYSNAFRVGFVPKERITSLVEALLEFQRSKLSREKKEEPTAGDDENCGAFTCSLCGCVFLKPVTLPCGHTFCEVCLWEEKSFTGLAECTKCGNVIQEDSVHSNNLLIMNAIQKWLPQEWQRQEVKQKGFHFLIGKDFQAAIDCFNRVLSTSSEDLHCLSWRSEAFLRSKQLELALRDIKKACKLRSSSARTFYRKFVILNRFARVEGILSAKHEQSVLVLLRCCALTPKCQRFRQEFTESLYRLLSPKFTNENRTLSVLKQGQDREGPLNFAQRSNAFDMDVDVFSNFMKSRAAEARASKGTKTKTHVHVSVNNEEVSEATSKADNTINKEMVHLRETEDFECKLCFSLLFQPITTICGHTFCRECLERCLDHRQECPCCRTTLSHYHTGTRKMEVTRELESILLKFFPGDYNERKKAFQEKLTGFQGLNSEQHPQVPIFVCTLAVPKVHCPLHIFEPRYRLMLRRCLESGSRQFGMCAGSEDPEKGFADYGTLLYVQSANFLPDGRSIVQTIGKRRFRVISRSMVDGYHTASVEWVQDERVDDVDELKHLIELNRAGYITLQTWFSHMNVEQRQCIANAVGPFPAFDENLHLLNDGPEWIWWVLAALPLTDKPKLIILSMTSILERLKSVIRFLQLLLDSLQKKSAIANSSTS